MHRHHLAEGAACEPGAGDIDEIEPAGLRFELCLGSHPPQDFLRIGQEGEHGGPRRRDMRLAANDKSLLHRCFPFAGCANDTPTWLYGLPSLVTRVARRPHDRRMQLSSTLAWLVDAAGESPGADRLLAELGAHLVDDGLPLAGGALTLEVPHPLIARRTWLWRADNGEVIEALGFAPGGPMAALDKTPANGAGRQWLTGIAEGAIHEDAIGPKQDGPSLAW